MKWMYDMKIGAKLMVSFIIIALITGIVGAMGMLNIKALEQSDSELYRQITIPIQEVGQISTEFQTLRVSLRDMIIAADAPTIKENANKIIEQQKKIDTIATEFEKTINSDEMKTAFNEFTVARQGYVGHLDVVINLAAQNQDTEAFAYMSSGSLAAQATKAEQDAIDKMAALKLEDGQLKSEANTSQANRVLTTMIIITLIGIATAIGFGLFLSSMISKPLKKANHMIKEMSMGHFSTRLNMDRKDEIGEMALSMDSFSDKIQNMVIGTMNRVSEGDVSANIEISDDQDEIAPALKQIIETIRGLIAEATMLSAAAVNGQLSTRGDAAAFKGGYREIV